MKARTFFFILLVSSIIHLYGQTELTGPVTKEAVLQKCADWQSIAAAYNPKPEFIERLRGLTREVRIEIFLGAWCSDSKAHVSEYFKVLEMADTPLIQTSYIAVPEDKTKRAAYYQDKDILKIPTFIVFMDGLEKGRIVEVPAKSVEEDLVEIIER
jgi:hypothetical protein